MVAIHCQALPYDNAGCLLMLSSGLLLPHTHAVPDRHANVGYGHCCQVHHRRMADASAGDGSAELVALLLPSWRQDERTRDNIIHAMMSPMMQGKLYGVVSVSYTHLRAHET